MQAALDLNELLDTAIVLTFIVFRVVRPQVFYYRYYTHCFLRPVALARNSLIAGIDGFEPSTNRLTVYCATAAPYPHNIYILLIKSFNSFADVGKLHDLNHLRIALSDTLYLFPIFTKDFNSK